jgi:hypothetical protein
MDQQELIAAGLPENLATELSKPEHAEALTAFVAKVKEPVISKNKEILEKLTALNGTVQQFGGLDAIKSMAEQVTQYKAQAEAKPKDDIESVKKTYADQLAGVSAERDSLKQRLVERDVQTALHNAIRDAKGEPALLEPIVRSRIKAEAIEGKVRIGVLTVDGVPMLNSEGKDASVKDLLAEIRSDGRYARAFEATKASGSGAVNSATGLPTGVDNPWNPASRNLTKQMEIARTNPNLAKSLAAMYNVSLDL